MGATLVDAHLGDGPPPRHGSEWFDNVPRGPVKLDSELTGYMTLEPVVGCSEVCDHEAPPVMPSPMLATGWRAEELMRELLGTAPVIRSTGVVEPLTCEQRGESCRMSVGAMISRVGVRGCVQSTPTDQDADT